MSAGLLTRDTFEAALWQNVPLAASDDGFQRRQGLARIMGAFDAATDGLAVARPVQPSPCCHPCGCRYLAEVTRRHYGAIYGDVPAVTEIRQRSVLDALSRGRNAHA